MWRKGKQGKGKGGVETLCILKLSKSFTKRHNAGERVAALSPCWMQAILLSGLVAGVGDAEGEEPNEPPPRHAGWQDQDERRPTEGRQVEQVAVGMRSVPPAPPSRWREGTDRGKAVAAMHQGTPSQGAPL